MAQLAAIVQKDPAVDNVMAFAAAAVAAPPIRGRMFITLKPLIERKRSADQIINRLRGKLSQIPGIQLFLQAVQDIRVGGRQQRCSIPVHAAGRQLDELNEWAPKLLDSMKTMPELRDARQRPAGSGPRSAPRR